jgi:hypothetical protein
MAMVKVQKRVNAQLPNAGGNVSSQFTANISNPTQCQQSYYRRHLKNIASPTIGLPKPPPSVGFGFGLPHLNVPQCLCRRTTILLPKVV